MDCLAKFALYCEDLETREQEWGEYGMDVSDNVFYTDGHCSVFESKEMFLSSPNRDIERTASVTEIEYIERQGMENLALSNVPGFAWHYECRVSNYILQSIEHNMAILGSFQNIQTLCITDNMALLLVITRSKCKPASKVFHKFFHLLSNVSSCGWMDDILHILKLANRTFLSFSELDQKREFSSSRS